MDVPASAASSVSGSPDASQSTGTPGSDSDIGVLKEVLVSAEKVTQNIQDVPMSVVALGEGQLQSASITSLEDIGRAVPGANVVSAGPGRNTLVMRGLSSQGVGFQSMVGYYIDDTPIASVPEESSGISDLALFDLARVEVLRGPQGTLYGASSMGGTIKYVTQQPNLQSFSGWTRALTSYTEGGDRPNEEIDSVLNLPLINDVLAVRVGAFSRYNGGYIDRYNTSPTDILSVLPRPASRDVNWEKTEGGRVQVEYRPIKQLTITPSVFIQDMNVGGESSIDYPPGTFDNPIQSRDLAEPFEDNLRLYALAIHAGLGRISITSSTSYFSRENYEIEDDSKETYYFYQSTGQTTVFPVPFYLDFPNHNFTQEIRGSFAAGNLDGQLGVFYQNVVGNSDFNWAVPNGYYSAFPALYNAFGGETTFYAGIFDTKDIQRAVYGQLTYALTSKLRATIGARKFNENQGGVVTAMGVLQGAPARNLISLGASGLTPKYNVSYSFTKNAMMYATASEGYREGGGFSPIPYAPCAADLAAIGLNSAPTSFSPDSVWNYELGGKTQWLDHRLTINADVYDIQWKNMQQTIDLVHCGFNFPGNAGTARSEGVELSVDFEPVSSLQVGLQGSFNQAQLTSTVVGADGVAGQEIPYAPKWSGDASVQYTRDISPSTSLYGRLDVNSSSRQYRDFFPTLLDHVQPGYSLVNGRVGTQFGSWNVSVFAINLLNKLASAAPEATYSVFIPTTYRPALQRPRTVGIDARLDY